EMCAVSQQHGRIFDLYLQIEGIQPVALINNDAEVCARFGEFDQGSFYLAGEDDQAADGDGVIAASFDRGNLGMGAPARATIFPPEAREVAAAIANHRGPIGGEPGPDQLAILPLYHRFARCGIDALDQESIRPGVHAIAYSAFAGHAWTQEFGHAELIIGGNMK